MWSSSRSGGGFDRPFNTKPVTALASPREFALAGVTFYLGANLVTHMGQAPEAVDALMASAERAAGMLDLLGGGGGPQE